MKDVQKKLELLKSAVFDLKAVDKKERTVSGYVSTITVDRDKEIILPSAFKQTIESFMVNPVILAIHNSRETPVGKAIEYKNITPFTECSRLYYIFKIFT